MRSVLPQVIRRSEVGWKKQLFVQPACNIDQGEIEKLAKTRTTAGGAVGSNREAGKAGAGDGASAANFS